MLYLKPNKEATRKQSYWVVHNKCFDMRYFDDQGNRQKIRRLDRNSRNAVIWDVLPL